MVKIKLSQTGKRNRKTYRIVVMEEGKRRDGKTIELLGFYNPLVKPPQLTINQDRLKYWISVGAQKTDGVTKILK
ncbi:MAG: 30S ribosomal protein S16 [Microgenomates group bacterium GW2011_GWB1_40_9]|nr:MAG: 30S ribosomal protein S16 [Microgenomates group bacterium GW2011_GWC1_39_12]KKR80114.1 MAG: 30S ribosomal protein S16 [Microgenomates group bacterium GW2011_GWB1_40_9]